MKKMKMFLIVLSAVVMVLGMSTSVFAQTVALDPADTDNAKITISNPAAGETYKVAKLFDATVSKATTQGQSDSIAYTGTIPSALSAYFEYVNGTDGTNGIKATDALDLSNATVQAALKTWAEANVTNQAVSDGTKPLDFTGLPYGYYVITTTQGEALLTVDSTNPTAEVIDKNTTPPISNPTKTADDEDVFIGQTVTYTVSFGTANFENGEKPITKYTIKDNFANGALTNVKVTSVKVDTTDIGTTTDGVYSIQFDANGEIEIPWVDSNGKSLYKNGAKLVITYTATVASSAQIDGDGNVNSVTISYTTDGEPVPYEEPVTATVYTYAIALQKVDQKGAPLAGAKFQLPFYVQEAADTDGAYIYAGTTAGDGLVNELTTPDSGLIIVKGVASGAYSITETEAPEGYNKLSGPVSVTAVQTGKETTNTTTYFDADGNQIDQHSETGFDVIVTIDELAATPIVVVNKTGSELPSTGGMGTTIFYVLGTILVIGAAIVLVSRRRMNNNK